MSQNTTTTHSTHQYPSAPISNAPLTDGLTTRPSLPVLAEHLSTEVSATTHEVKNYLGARPWLVVGGLALGALAVVMYRRRRKRLVMSFDEEEVRELRDDDLLFLARWRGISQLDAAQRDNLSKLVVEVWKDIKQKAHTYRCVQSMSFLTPKAKLHPDYGATLDLARECMARGETFSWLDVGCAFGQNSRLLVADGIPASSITVADIHDKYWQAGHRLFGDAQFGSASFSLQGVHEAFCDWAQPLGDEDREKYENSFRAIMLMAVLHVLSQKQSETMLERLATCGAMGCRLLGYTVGAKAPGEWGRTPDNAAPRYLHSIETLKVALAKAGWAEVNVSLAGKEFSAPGKEDPTDKDHVRLVFSATKP